MIRVNNIKANLDVDMAGLKEIIAMRTGLAPQNIKTIRIAKKSVDARNKSNVCFVYSFDIEIDGNETEIYDTLIKTDCERLTHEKNSNNFSARLHPCLRPIVVGTGPAGMFAGLALAKLGLAPILLERGKEVSRRKQDVAKFWQSGQLNPSSNVQFGEGGAGTFSDGKLMTGIKKSPFMRQVLEELAAAGAPEEILYLAKPHIGTDKLVKVVENIRHKITALGGEYRFEHQLIDLMIKDNKIQAVKVKTPNGEIEEIAADCVILALGHSARDTFQMLFDRGLQIEQKPFSVGVRIEHSQQMINESQYGRYADHPALGAADYKLAVHYPDGRSAYTFCMCPGGQVVAAASEEKTVVTNGMSEFARDKENANAALLVGVTPDDFGGKHPLQGMYFQQQLEHKAFELGGENYHAPAQLVGDFLRARPSTRLGAVKPSYAPGVTLTNLEALFPEYITATLAKALVDMNKRLKGFADDHAVMTGVETRSSSPIRIYRDENFESNIKGIYPCGEGAGYAGGIVSSAVDGLKVCCLEA